MLCRQGLSSGVAAVKEWQYGGENVDTGTCLGMEVRACTGVLYVEVLLIIAMRL